MTHNPIVQYGIENRKTRAASITRRSGHAAVWLAGKHVLLFVLATLALISGPATLGSAETPDYLHRKESTHLIHHPRPWQAEVTPTLGLRRDRLKWNISGNNVNILSELIVDDIDIFQAGLETAIEKGGYRLFVLLAHGEILGGTNIDRDYLENNRGGLYSESVADVSDCHAMDFSGGVGRIFDFRGGRYRLTPYFGGSWHRLRLLKTSGVQTVATSGRTPTVGPFPGLASTYDASWASWWAGGSFQVKVGNNLRLSASSRYNRFDFHADANWNLRQDLAHPVSFTHRASGEGFDLGIACEWQTTSRLSAFSEFYYKYWTAENGIDTTYFESGNKMRIPLNKVSWRSRSVTAGIRYRF